MEKVNSQIERFHASDYAFFSAFNMYGFGSSNHNNKDEHELNATDHYGWLRIQNDNGHIP